MNNDLLDRNRMPSVEQGLNSSPPSPPSFAKLSNSYLQRKFKLNHHVASIVLEVFNKLNLDEIWFDVTKSLPKHREEVIVHGKLFTSKEEETFETHLAFLDARCGWLNTDTSASLYVTHWMYIPAKSDSEKNNNEEIVEKEHYSRPPKIKKTKLKEKSKDE